MTTTLTNKVSIYVPTTYKVNKKVNTKTQVNNTLKFLSGLFGGCTVNSATGGWIADNGELITEKVNICYSYCDKKSLSKSLDKILCYCRDLKNELKQEAISVEINNKLYFI